jgi:hypothetical protein
MRLKNLEQYKTGGGGNEMQLSIPLPKTPEGRVYRYSPNENAHPRHFLLGNRVEGFQLPATMTPRMTRMPGTPGTRCPYSGLEDEDSAFTHPDDIEAAKAVVSHAAQQDVAEALHGVFADLARKSSGNKFVQFKTGPRPPSKPRPRFGRRDLLRELVCDECGRDYGVYAISLFCPDCGAPNIHLHFAREVALVRQQVELVATLGAEQQELAYRLLGNAHEDVLTAFEATLKTVYLHKAVSLPANAPPIKPPGNAFQNVERGQKRFAEFGFDPFAGLAPETLAMLATNIQKRHVIGHNLGIADAAFAEHAADARLGETVPLVGEDILQFAQISQMVVNAVDAWLANGRAPPTEVKLEKPVVPPAAPAPLKIGQLSALAIRIGVWISKESKKGFRDFIGEDALKQAFPDASLDDLAFAVAELAKDGFLDISHTLSNRLPRMFATAETFVTFDPHAFKTDPASDAAALVDLALAQTKGVDVEKLHAETGWPIRRFNPAFSYMIAHVDDRRVLKGGSNDYPARGFVLVDEDRVDLKRFASRLRPT